MSLTKTAAVFLAAAITVSGLTFMTVTSSDRQQKEEQSKITYSSPSAGLSTEIILTAIDSTEISVDFLSVSEVAQENTAETEACVSEISDYISQIEAYVEQARESAQDYDSALEIYEKAADLLEQANAAKEAAESSKTYILAQMYVQEVSDMVSQAAAYASETEEAALEAAQEEAQENIQSTRQALVNYALSFVGVTPYKYGGTSLTGGADCSGFTMAVYAHFGYSLPHSSSSQAKCGRSVSVSEIEIGDIVYYSGHVGIYIGNGMIVHSPSPGKKVCTTSMYFMTIKSIRRIIE